MHTQRQARLSPAGAVIKRARARASPLLHWLLPIRAKVLPSSLAAASTVSSRRTAGAEVWEMYQTIVKNHDEGHLLQDGGIVEGIDAGGGPGGAGA